MHSGSITLSIVGAALRTAQIAHLVSQKTAKFIKKQAGFQCRIQPYARANA